MPPPVHSLWLYIWDSQTSQLIPNFVPSYLQVLDEIPKTISEKPQERFLIELFEKDILTQAEEVYNMFLFSYQEGEIGSIELIEARRTLLEARKAYADALFNHGVALAALEKSIGQSLEGESL